MMSRVIKHASRPHQPSAAFAPTLQLQLRLIQECLLNANSTPRTLCLNGVCTLPTGDQFTYSAISTYTLHFSGMMEMTQSYGKASSSRTRLRRDNDISTTAARSQTALYHGDCQCTCASAHPAVFVSRKSTSFTASRRIRMLG